MTFGRSRFAGLAGALVWAMGTLVLPVLHLANHARPHDHEGGGIHYHLDAGADDDHDDDDDPSGPPTVEAPHGHHHSHAPHAAGLAHFAAATSDGTAGAVAPAATPQAELASDAPAGRFAEYLLEGNRGPRAPPAG